jgi:hypothetical protein
VNEHYVAIASEITIAVSLSAPLAESEEKKLPRKLTLRGNFLRDNCRGKIICAAY